MLSRRDLLRAGTLGGLVVAAPGLFAACSDGGSPPPKGSPSGAAGGIRLVSSDVARDAADPAAIGTGAASVLALGGGLYGQLVGAGGNLGLSPYSAAVALGMTVNGAVGATRDEMLAVLARCRHRVARRGAERAHGVRRVAGRSGPGRRTTPRSRSPRPTSSSVRPTTRGRSPSSTRWRAASAPGSARSTTSTRPRRRASRSTAGPPSRPTTGSPRSSPGRARRPDPAGPGQRAVLQGSVGRALREGRHHRRRLPPGRRLDRRGADHARHGGLRRGRRLASRPPVVRRRHPGHDGRAPRRGHARASSTSSSPAAASRTSSRRRRGRSPCPCRSGRSWPRRRSRTR